MNAIEAAQHVVANRVVDGTKTNYKGKLNTIKLYLLSRPDNHELLTPEGNITFPLPVDVVKALFGWLSINTDLPEKKRDKS